MLLPQTKQIDFCLIVVCFLRPSHDIVSSITTSVYTTIHHSNFDSSHDSLLPVLHTVGFVHDPPSLFAVYPGLILLSDQYLICSNVLILK